MAGRVAILLIHGMGEQRPMQTLKGFVRAFLGTRDERDRDLYSRPDIVSNSYELRSLATRATKANDPPHPPIHFVEFYWAHHMAGSTFAQISIWIGRIFLRWPWTVPARNLFPWTVAWLAALSVCWAITCLPALAGTHAVLVGLAAIAAIGLRLLSQTVLTDWVGDAARYLSATPRNVAVRQTIRTAGVEVLRRMHRSGDYDRIIVVGHSLGSVIAVDILHHYWFRARYAGTGETRGPQPALGAFEDWLQALASAGTVPDWQQVQARQRALFAEMRALGVDWRVSDLVTLGSPLSSFEFLAGLRKGELKTLRADREVPQCPPVLDEGRLTGPRKAGARLKLPHHGAVFAATRWTNLYFPCSGPYGDPIGGPIAANFGPGIRDIAVNSARAMWWGVHTAYWDDLGSRDQEGDSLATLVRSLDLGFRP